MNEKEKIIDDLRSLLIDKAEFALIFGSFAKDSFNNNSDIDVAVYLKDEFLNRDKRAEITRDLILHLKRDIDIIFLNDADLIISMQAIANGEPIFINDESKFVLYKAGVLSRYPDFKMSRKIIEDNMLNGRIHV